MADIGRLTLPYALRMDDNCYMGRALESRQPFLDYRLVEFGLSLPSKLKIRRGISKFLLRSAVRDFVPPSRRRDLNKIGLNLPIDVWMRGPIKGWLLDNLADAANPIYQFAEHGTAQRLLTDHFSEHANHSLKLWDIACTNMWLKKFFS